MNNYFCFVRMAALGLAMACSSVWAQSTAFTYQGELTDTNGPVTGTCNFTFDLFDAPTGGTQLASVAVSGVTVTEGLFATLVDFGGGAADFDGGDRFLQISVDCGSGTSTLPQRQPLTPSPYSITSYSTEGLQGVPVSDTTPTDGEVLKFSGGTWAPATDADGGGDVTDVTVTGGSGLTVTNSAGPAPNLSTDTNILQARVSGTCNGGQKVTAVNQDGSVVCGADTDTNTGDLTVQGGNFISGGGDTGTVTLDLEAISCPAGQYIESINTDGTVTCTDAPSITGWEINSATCTFNATGFNACGATAFCSSSSKRVIAGGGKNSCIHALLGASAPQLGTGSNGEDGWRAVITNINTGNCTGANTLTTYAICADVN